ncbi:MAG: pantoate--beta-alanine ligase, partial [Flavobacteriales bacterium]|nr:pantoate--beta-alanine ligase [Flavobacteriales bacterium]
PKKDNDITVCSIYVNPTQFNDQQDFEKYPRLIEDDMLKLEDENCDALFAPDSAEMYPKDDSIDIPKELDLGELAHVMEGQFRPGHFDGVVTIVEKLFSAITPDRAYFGLKDYQQLAVVRTMNEQLDLGIEVIGCPTVREADGLALSSRNLLLSKEQRSEAPAIFKSLIHGRDHLAEFDVDEFKRTVAREIEDFATLQVEYVEVSDSKSLRPLNKWTSADSAVCCVAVHAGGVRLIVNIILYN